MRVVEERETKGRYYVMKLCLVQYVKPGLGPVYSLSKNRWVLFIGKLL